MQSLPLDQSTRDEPMQELWQPVKGYEGLYEVSDQGWVWNYQKLLKLTPDPFYYKVSLCKEGKSTKFRVHQLVAAAFLPDPPGPTGTTLGCYQVDHINENKFDNRAENLRWVPMEWNMYHRYEGTHHLPAMASHPGEKHGMAKLVAEQVLAIRADTRTYKEIAADYGVDKTQIGHIKCRRSWKHI